MSSRGWTGNVSSIASRIYFFLIILQIPLFSFPAIASIPSYSPTSMNKKATIFGPILICTPTLTARSVEPYLSIKISYRVPRIPCRSGMCTTPVEVTSSKLVATDIFPVVVVKALLYPGAVANSIINNMTIPRWDNILNIYNLTNVKEASPMIDLQRLEVLAGSYFAVAGAFVGLLKPGRMNMFGTLLVIWGLVKEGILGKPVNTDPTKAVYIYPTMVIALVCAFASVKYNVKKITRAAPVRPIAKPLKSSAKSKLK